MLVLVVDDGDGEVDDDEDGDDDDDADGWKKKPFEVEFEDEWDNGEAASNTELIVLVLEDNWRRRTTL